jgi:hypothetical protein
MLRALFLLMIPVLVPVSGLRADGNSAAYDPNQYLERTCFQTGQGWSGAGNLRSDVAIVYGIDARLPQRIQTWRDHGYVIHVMTGVSWGNYQDYLDGRFDGTPHNDEAQTDRNGRPHRHGDSSDVFYMCPGTNYGKYLCVGVRRALEAGVQAIHLEEPEFWVQDGYEAAFRREWRSYYGEDWMAPHDSVDAQWRASKLKYFLYRRALQQVFDFIQEHNRTTGQKVRCYVPTHSLLNYAHWRIVSPESSLARLEGCDGYIAQVWTGTSRTPNVYRGKLRERTFETAFLEYGAMQNLVRATGRTVWYLNDPVEDNPRHDWEDYRVNWESTLVASLLQPDVWRYEVAPWPERVFAGRYPAGSPNPQPIPPPYSTELQVVMNALNDMNQSLVKWDCGTTGIGLLVSDSLMFQRGQPTPSDAHLSHVYGLALPLLKRGMPVAPVQLENLTVPGCLDGFRLLLLSYQGMKPLSPDVHAPLADWVRRGGTLVVCDDDSDPYLKVREWWNTGANNYPTPRVHLFEQLGMSDADFAAGSPEAVVRVGKGRVAWLRANPASLADSDQGDARVLAAVRAAAKRTSLSWRETNYLLLRRGPYLVGAGLDESIPGEPKEIQGRFVNLFDPDLRVRQSVPLPPGARVFLLDLESVKSKTPKILASGCKSWNLSQEDRKVSVSLEGVAHTPGILLLSSTKPPKSIELDGQGLATFEYSPEEKLLWVRFPNEPRPRRLAISF